MERQRYQPGTFSIFNEWTVILQRGILQMFYHGKLIKSLIEYQQRKYRHRKMNKTLI